MKQILVIIGDTNDGNYITEQTTLKDWSMEQLPIIKKVAKAISEQKVKSKWESNWQRHNYGRNNNPPEIMYKDILTNDEIEIFDEFRPHHENGIHTVVSVRILTIADEEILL